MRLDSSDCLHPEPVPGNRPAFACVETLSGTDTVTSRPQAGRCSAPSGSTVTATVKTPSPLLPLSNHETKGNLHAWWGNEGGEPLHGGCVGVGWGRGRGPTGEFWGGTAGTSSPPGSQIQEALVEVGTGTTSRFISKRPSGKTWSWGLLRISLPWAGKLVIYHKSATKPPGPQTTDPPEVKA